MFYTSLNILLYLVDLWNEHSFHFLNFKYINEPWFECNTNCEIKPNDLGIWILLNLKNTN